MGAPISLDVHGSLTNLHINALLPHIILIGDNVLCYSGMFRIEKYRLELLGVVTCVLMVDTEEKHPKHWV